MAVRNKNDGILEAAEVNFASGRRMVVSGARVVSGAEKKHHLIQAAPFGCLDQMLSTIICGQESGGLCPPLNDRTWQLIEATKRGCLDQMLFLSAPFGHP